jgi:hypothetical protein
MREGSGSIPLTKWIRIQEAQNMWIRIMIRNTGFNPFVHSWLVIVAYTQRCVLTDGMTAADGVAELLEVGGEPGGVQALYQVHALAVQALQHKENIGRGRALANGEG